MNQPIFDSVGTEEIKRLLTQVMVSVSGFSTSSLINFHIH